MPVHGVRSYLETVVNLNSLLPDEVLVKSLLEVLEADKAAKPKPLTRLENLEATVINSALFTKMPDHVKEEVMECL